MSGKLLSGNGRNGQSLVEVVMSIGLIILTITGVVILVLQSLASRTKGYDRKKAVELSQIVMESLVAKEVTDPVNFWNLSSAYWQGLGTSQVNSAYPGYAYSVKGLGYSGNNCSTSTLECLNAVVRVGWSGSSNSKIDEFNRFFSKKSQ